MPTASNNLSIYAKNSLNKLGVEVKCNTVVQNISEGMIETNSENIEAGTIIWCAGVVSSPIKRWISVETDKIGRAIVSDDLSIPSYTNIFVIGDASHVKDKNGKPFPAKKWENRIPEGKSGKINRKSGKFLDSQQF